LNAHILLLTPQLEDTNCVAVYQASEYNASTPYSMGLVLLPQAASERVTTSSKLVVNSTADTAVRDPCVSPTTSLSMGLVLLPQAASERVTTSSKLVVNSTADTAVRDPCVSPTTSLSPPETRE
jgi:hypothetical protein